MNAAAVAPQLSPKVIPGCGNTHSNSGFPTILSDGVSFAFQSAVYGPQQLLACSSAVSNGGEVIFIYDMNSMQLTQSLSGHKAAVRALLWHRPPASYLQTGLFLWSGDARGVLMYWDVVEGVALTSIQTPCQGPVQSLSLLTEEHLLVVTAECNSYIFNSHLVDNTPLPPGSLPLEVQQCSLLDNRCRPTLVALSRLNDQHCCAIVLGDRLRIIRSMQLEGGGETPAAKDLIYDSGDGSATVLDAFFSDAQEEVLYFATRNTVGCYDWKLGLMLNESFLWMQDEVEFRRIFRSSATFTASFSSSSLSSSSSLVSSESAARELPVLYSFGSDQRLVAWHVARHDRFTTVATDVRGVRINSKLTANVVQSDLDPSRFAVLFEDGAIAHWQYRAASRRWKLLGCWLAPVVRPVTCCPVGAHHCCVALESGHLALMDVTHAIAVRRFNLVYSGGTQIVLLCGHKWSDLVWAVSDRVQQYRHHHQVSLIDTRTGEVVRVLRKPSSVPEQARMKEITMDPTTTYVLLTYWNGTFEVWTAEDSRLVHIHSGLGVANVSWAPPSMRRCLSGVQGTPQLLAVLFSEGTLSLWSVYKDRVVVSRDAIPLFNPAVAERAVRSAVVGDGLVTWDGHGGGVVLHAQGTRLAVRRLRDAPVSSGAVLCLAGPAPPSRTAAANEFMSFSSPLGWAGASSFARDGDAAAATEEGGAASVASPTSAAVDGSGSSTRMVAVLFEIGVFAVWDITTGERRALSSSGMPADVRALSLYWSGESLCVLGTDGCLYVFDANLAEMNSSVRYRALRRPMKNLSFLLPAHRTYVQVSLELDSHSNHDRGGGAAKSGTATTADDNSDAAAAAAAATVSSASFARMPSAVMEAVPVSARPCRGPFGQLLTEEIVSLHDELELYRTTMVPNDVLQQLARCNARYSLTGMAAAAVAGSVSTSSPPTAPPPSPAPLLLLERSIIVAGFLGQVSKQRFMRLALAALQSWMLSVQYLSSPQSPFRLAPHAESVQGSDGGRCSAPPLSNGSPGSHVADAVDAVTTVPVMYPCADPYAEALATPSLVRRNRTLLNEQRTAALQVNVRNCYHSSNSDNCTTRLSLARDWLQLQNHQQAIEVLLDTPSQSAYYNEMATLGMAVAAASGAKAASSADSALSTLFTASAKRAAAMLLAQGDVSAAVEKLVLAGEYRGACLTLQSKGLWRDAVVLVKAMPQLQPAVVEEVLLRWSALSVQRGYRLLGAALLLAAGGYCEESRLSAPLSALSLLMESAHFTDVAGVLALVLSQYHDVLRAGELGGAAVSGTSTPLRSSGASTTLTSAAATETGGTNAMTEAVLHALGDYSSLLHTVGNLEAESLVLQQAAQLKLVLRRS
jgi:WD repeat-containing protein 11